MSTPLRAAGPPFGLFHPAPIAPFAVEGASRGALKALVLGVLAALATAVAGAAQAVYVPIPSTSALGQAPQVLLSVANGDTAQRRFGVYFIPEGQDGTVRSTDPGKTPVAPGLTAILDTSSLVSGNGLLEVSGTAAPLFVNAELLLQLHGGASDLALPVLSPANAFPANGTVVLQSLRRAPDGTFTSLELVNLGKQTSECSISVQGSDGSQVAPAAVVTVLPLSARSFSDFLSASTVSTLSDVTAQVACDQSFYAYATIYSPSTQLHLVPPSASLNAGQGAGAGTGTGPGTGGPGSGGPPPLPVTVTRGGLFFAPVAGASVLDVPLPVALNQSYSVATVEFDLLVGPFTEHYTSIVGFLRPGSNRLTRTLYYGFNIRGNLGRTFVDLGVVGLEPALKGSFRWTIGVRYHIKLIYDVVQKTFTLDVSLNGQLLSELSGANFNWDLADHGTGMKLQFGLPGSADGAYFPPPNGWQFSNLAVTVQ